MRSCEYAPSGALRPFVRLFWAFELAEPAGFGPPERVTPDGLLELVFHYGTPFACRYDGESFAGQQRSVAVSQTRRFVEFQPRGPSGLVSVRFQPWGAYHFFPMPVCELADRQTPVEALWGAAARELEERLGGARGDRERVGLVEAFLLAQLDRHRKADVEPLVRAAWSRAGRADVAGLARDLGIGERRLQRTFAEALGTTPKGFLRLTRFLHACRLLRDGSAGSLAELGLACGYYDQSHLTSEFRAFSGFTPRQFVETSQLSFLPLD